MSKLARYARVFSHWRLKKSEELPYLPEDISVELTNTCNFKCSFCPQSDPTHFQKVQRSTLSPETASLLLRKIREGGVKTNVIHWTLDGEPFVNKKIDEICETAIDHGFRKFIFSTNGYFCTPDRLEGLPRREAATYRLCIDFCADKTLFERHRGTPNSWQRIKENIETILQSETLNFVELKVTDISSFGDDEQSHSDGLQRLKELFGTHRRLLVASRVFHNATGHVQGLADKKRAATPSYNLCPYPWTSLVVASNGDVVACCRDLQHKTVLGNLLETDLPEIWNGSRYRALRRSLADKQPDQVDACRGCDMPYDASKFTWTHLARTATRRLGMLN